MIFGNKIYCRVAVKVLTVWYIVGFGNGQVSQAGLNIGWNVHFFAILEIMWRGLSCPDLDLLGIWHFYVWGYHSVPLLFLQVFNKLIRRYKYLEKGFEDEVKKVWPAICFVENKRLGSKKGMLNPNSATDLR